MLSYSRRRRWVLRVRVELPAEGLNEPGRVPTRWDGGLVTLKEFDAHGDVLRTRPVLLGMEGRGEKGSERAFGDVVDSWLWLGGRVGSDRAMPLEYARHASRYWNVL